MMVTTTSAGATTTTDLTITNSKKIQMRCETDDQFKNREHKSEPSGPKKSDYIGVTYNTKRHIWQSRWTKNGKTYYFGRYRREIDAAAAYVAGKLAVDEKRLHKPQWDSQDIPELHRTHKPQKRKAKAQRHPKKPKRARMRGHEFAVGHMVEVLWEEDGTPRQYLRAKIVAHEGGGKYGVQWVAHEGDDSCSYGIPADELRRPTGP